MKILCDALSPKDAASLLVNAIIPPPIAFVTSLDLEFTQHFILQTRLFVLRKLFNGKKTVGQLPVERRKMTMRSLSVSQTYRSPNAIATPCG